jgi:hypothetical protein
MILLCFYLKLVMYEFFKQFKEGAKNKVIMLASRNEGAIQ